MIQTIKDGTFGKNNVLTKETVEPVRENKSQPVEKKQLSSQSKGRDYLMDLLKK